MPDEVEIKPADVLPALREGLDLPAATITPASMTPMALIARAIDRGYDEARLEKLMGLQERWEANEARKAFTAAMAAFKAEDVVIRKVSDVSYGSGQGKTAYSHADLGNMMLTVSPVLSKHELSLTWEVDQSEDLVVITCNVTHALGHREAVTMRGPLDTSGSKNTIQAIGSTSTYLRRYTALAALGLAAVDEDDDALSAYQHPTIDDEQALVLKDLARETGLSIDKFKQRFPYAQAIDDLRPDDYPVAVKLFEDRKKVLAERADATPETQQETQDDASLIDNQDG